MGLGIFACDARAGTFDSITVDGNPSDWNTVPIAASASASTAIEPNPDLVQLKMANDNNYIYFLVTFAQPVDPTSNGGTVLAVDSDNNYNTGFNIYGLNLAGANASYQNDFPYTQTASGFNTGSNFTNQAMSEGPAYFPTGNARTYQELAIPINAAQSDSSSGGYTGPLFQTSTNSFTVLFYNGNSVLGPYTYTIAGPPVVSTYALAGAGDFNSTSSWTNGVPNAADAEADFENSITANHTVYSDTSITLGKIVFNSPNTYVLAGAGDLTLSVSTGSATVDAQAGTQKITLPITIASNTILNADSGATLVIGAPVTINPGVSLTQSGSGMVQYLSSINVSSGASISMAASSNAGALALLGSSSATLLPETGGTKTALQLTGLSVASGSTLDIKNGDVIVHNGNFNAIQAEVASGFNSNGASWTGTGITSSTAAADTTHLTAVAVIQNSNSSGGALYSTFDGDPLQAGDVLVKYTYYGDATLSGSVDSADYSRIDNGFITHSTGWYNGDFNYDGVVNGSDYTLIDNAFNTQGGVIGSSPAVLIAAQIAGGTAATAAVPEPASIGVVGVCLAGLLGRRRRSL
jgi:hypothetical protein